MDLKHIRKLNIAIIPKVTIYLPENRILWKFLFVVHVVYYVIANKTSAGAFVKEFLELCSPLPEQYTLRQLFILSLYLIVFKTCFDNN